MALDMTSFASGLKQHYMPLVVQNLVYKDNPFLALCPKYEDFGGLNMPIPLIYGNPQGRSATFSNASAQKTTTKITAFTLTRAKDYSLANIDNETIEASQGDANAFLRAATTEIDGAIQSAARSLASSMFRSGTGSIGQISSGSTVASTAITLANIEDVVGFEVGMTIGASSADGSGARTGSAVLTAVNRLTGVLTTGSNWSTQITSLATGDYLYVAGDLNAKIKGLAAWVPNSDPSSTAFFGVDRSVDVSRLGGLRKSYVGVPIEEALIDSAALVGREGGKPDTCLMSFGNYANLEKALGSKVQYVDLKGPANIAFSGIKVIGPKGPISVVPDQNCQSDRFFMLQLNSWKLCTLGMAPKLLKSDGLDFLRVSSEDSVEVRVGYYGQLGCHAPGYNMVGVLS